MQPNEKYNYMTKTPIPKLIIRLAVPTTITMLITSLYNTADTYFVGKIDTSSATGAVGVAFAFMALIQAIGFFFGHGSGNFISRKLGEKNSEEAQKMASTGFIYSFCFGVVLLIVGFIFLDKLALALGSTETILPYTKQYLSYILIGAPFMTSSLVLNNQLRFQGSALYGMIGMISGGLINIALDPLFMFVFNMGISGAAFATVISQIISFSILLIGTSRGGNIKIKLSEFTLKPSYIKHIFQGGLPSLCRQGLASIASILLAHAAKEYGDSAIAAMTIVSKVTMIANSALIGFGQGFQPVCGFNYGAKFYSRVKQGFHFCVRVSAVFLVVISVTTYIFAPQIIMFFRADDSKVLEIGTLALRVQCLIFPLNSWLTMCNMMLQSSGKAFRATLIAISKQGLFFIPLVFLLPNIAGLLGIQIVQPISDFLTFVLSVPLGISFINELNQPLTMEKKKFE